MKSTLRPITAGDIDDREKYEALESLMFLNRSAV